RGRLMRKSQQFLPGPPLGLFHVPYNREIPPFQGRVRGWARRKHRETALKILSRRKPPGNVILVATASEGPRDESFTHVLTSCSFVALLMLFLIISCAFVSGSKAIMAEHVATRV